MRETHGIPEGDLDYVEDDTADSNVLYSEKFGLRGRPDYVIEREGKQVPVKARSGRVPRGPLFSHILQIGGYCLLLEDITKTRPEYGIIKYGSKEHMIEFDDKLRETVLKKMKAIRQILTGVKAAHRNHDKPGKCFNCSRRSVCSERLV